MKIALVATLTGLVTTTAVGQDGDTEADAGAAAGTAAAWQEWPDAHRCPADGPAFTHETGLTEQAYAVPGKSAKLAMIALTEWERPFSPTGQEIGYFDYDYEIRVEMSRDADDAPIVERACFRSKFLTVGPAVERRLQPCFSRFLDHVAEHEAEHVTITRAVLDEVGEKLIGASPAEAQAMLASLDERIVAANVAFHGTPAGGPPPLAISPLKRCKGSYL